MPEIATTRRKVDINYLCDECKEGIMRSTRMLKEPNGYHHECSVCSNYTWFPEKYPKQVEAECEVELARSPYSGYYVIKTDR